MIDRTDDARAHDDHELIDDAERAPSAQRVSGGRLAAEIGSEDEERALAEGEGITRVRGSDKPDAPVPTRADNQGANG